jgi:hypothetical protein
MIDRTSTPSASIPFVRVCCPSFFPFSRMSSLPQRRVSQPQSADSWHSVPSHHSYISGDTNSVPQNEAFVDLNPAIPLGNDQQQGEAVGSGILVVPEKKKCWICLAEEGEMFSNGTPVNPSRWSKACACSLDAHEACLITWINQSRGGDPSKTVPLNYQI